MLQALRSIAQAWNRFWFEPASTATLAVLRIAFGTLTFLWTVTLGFDLRTFFSVDGMLPSRPEPDWTWSVLDAAPGDAAVVALYVALLVASVFLAVGYRTRASALVVFVALVSFERRNPFVFNSGDVLFRILALYLVLAPAGVALSVDRWRRDREAFWSFPRRAPWVVRLVQVQLAVIYLSTVLAKLRGATWQDGTAVSYALRITDHARFEPPGFLTGWEPLVAALTYGTLAVETSLGTLVWFRRLRPYVVALGVTMHLAIDLSLLVGFFSFVMLTAYLAWVPPETMERALLRLRDRRRGAAAEPPALAAPPP